MKQRGTGFTNVSRILQANQGSRLGQTVSGGIEKVSKDVKTGIQKAQTDFEKESRDKALNIDEAKQKRDTILGKVTGNQPMMQQSGVTDQTTQQPTSGRETTTTMPAPTTESTIDRSQEQPQAAPQPFTGLSDQEVKDFEKLRTASYTGPKELQNAEALTNQAMQAEQLGSLTRSGGGQQELLRRFVGGEGYTQGQRKLDQTILSQDKNANITAAARQSRGIAEDVNRATERARNFAEEMQGRARQFSTETGEMLTQAKTPIMEGLSQRLEEARAKEEQLSSNYNKIQNIFRGVGDFGRLSDQERLTSGLTQARDLGLMGQAEYDALTQSGGLVSRGNTVGMNLAEMLGQRLQMRQGQNLTQGGVASEEERAKLQALNKLAGGLDTDFALAGQEGQYEAGGTSFDKEALDKEIINKELPHYQNQIASINNQLAQLDRFEKEFGYGFSWNKGDRNYYYNTLAALNNQMAQAQANLKKTQERQKYYDDLARQQLSDKNKKTDVSYDPKDVEKFMGRLKASSYNYKDEVKDSPLASKNREIGVMAQDLEKSKLGKEAVKDTKIGKIVDYDNLGPKMLASIANLNERLKKMEGK